ncbi:tRNA methyltransferase [Niveomyces insectorum RCEF 264]|uniref:tRNA methyltransferase n=1 Tax=Niveomyces insectorum RCEF 264 TaxID=1081102 RepID=A0A167QBI6_9HYPO|nr:tRNA methyltransferase [Niveomyces insectorum RCEF 264]
MSALDTTAAPGQEATAAATEANGKRPFPGGSPRRQQQNGDPASRGGNRRQKPPKKKFKGGRKPNAVTEGTSEEVLLADIQDLLSALKIKQENATAVALSEPVLMRNSHADVKALAGKHAAEADADRKQRQQDEELAQEEEEEEEDLPEPGTEIELDVVDLSSTGEGLAVQRTEYSLLESEAQKRGRRRRRIYVVSFAVPGDIVRARVYRHLSQPRSVPGETAPPPTYSVADVLEVVRPSPELRDPSGDDSRRVRCPYFGRCSGCQYQMLDYAEQLRIKRRVVARAYRHFSQLPPESVPPVQDTVPSPLQYGYRTKLTPHFDGPPGFRRKNKVGATLTAVPDIGFMAKAGTAAAGGGARTTLDIEQCPIGTPAVVAGLARERARVARDYATYQRGATILLRESTERRYKSRNDDDNKGDDDDDGNNNTGAAKPGASDEVAAAGAPSSDAVVVDTDAYTDTKTCITDNNATSTEYVDDYVFTNPAGSFFQNNNSILPALTAYVRQNVVRPVRTATKATTEEEAADEDGRTPLRYLVDAYCGSGLFTIALASTLPGGSIGIDIAEQSIAYARANAALNHLPSERCRFVAADAAQLFAGVLTYDADETVVVLDPPRKGCDAPFLRQLLAFAPARIVYVSCNVHTQARDVGMLVRGEVNWGPGTNPPLPPQNGEDGGQGDDAGKAEKRTPRYEIESLRGFDFFPQTAHVESIAVLNRVDLV